MKLAETIFKMVTVVMFKMAVMVNLLMMMEMKVAMMTQMNLKMVNKKPAGMNVVMATVLMNVRIVLTMIQILNVHSVARPAKQHVRNVFLIWILVVINAVMGSVTRIPVMVV